MSAKKSSLNTTPSTLFPFLKKKSHKHIFINLPPPFLVFEFIPLLRYFFTYGNHFLWGGGTLYLRTNLLLSLIFLTLYSSF